MLTLFAASFFCVSIALERFTQADASSSSDPSPSRVVCNLNEIMHYITFHLVLIMMIIYSNSTYSSI